MPDTGSASQEVSKIFFHFMKIKNVSPLGPTNWENVICLLSPTSVTVAIELVSGLSNRVLQKVIQQ